MKRHYERRIATVLAVASVALWPQHAPAVEMVRPSLVVYVIENKPLTADRLTIPETIVNAELLRRGYRIVPSLFTPDVARTIAPNVKGVWNADRRMSFQQHFRADLLWMSTVEYTLDSTSRPDSVSGKVSVMARALNTATGESLWFGRVSDRPLKGATPADAARLALAEIIPALVADFDRAPKVRAWTPPEPPPASPSALTPGARLPGMTAAPTPVSPSGSPYTGVIIDARDLPVQPNYRTGIYTPQGTPLYSPERQRLNWSDSLPSARQQAGPNPLVIRPQSGQGGRIILRENDARTLQGEKSLRERKPPTVIVRPPKR